MRYGYFDDKNKEYVITTPSTPLPWINYLGNDGFFSLISNTCGGYSFYKDAKLRRITRFRYNNIPRDEGGRYYYINDNGCVWNPGFMPCRTDLDSYECRHGLGYSKFTSSKNGISAELTCFVPLNTPCEINRLVLSNTCSRAKTFSLYSAVEWCLWNAVDDSTNFQRNYNIGEVEVEGSTIYHKTEYRERRNHYSFFTVNSPISGYETDLDTFLGKFGSWDRPDTVLQDKAKNSNASGWSPMACHFIRITLQPGEKKSFIFQLGYVENPRDHKFESKGVINKEKAHALIDAFSDDNKVNDALNDLHKYWDDLLSRFQISSEDSKFDRMMNIWNQYQCMITFNMSRSASYYESGIGRGMGFRDSCQDLLGFVHMIPGRARERILDIAAIQFEDGSTYHQYQPLTKRGNSDIGSGFNDDPLWLIACTSAYIKETGDSSILNEMVQFNNKEGSERTLFEHLRRSINYTVTHKGPHGLPLIGRADWNDCLNLNCFSEEPGESFQTCSNFESGKAESVFIAGMFVKYGHEYADICSHFGSKNEADYVEREVDKIYKAVLDYGWDGEWFIRAYDAFENKIGSSECEEGKIFIEPQGFCIMAGIGIKEGLAEKALDSVDKYLTDDFGVELLHPCYTEYHKELGEISSYPPGYKENGSVFCHNNPWIVLANTKVHNSQRAFSIYKKNCPSYIEDMSDIHRTEPYVYSQTIAGRDAKNYGEGKNSWLTGTAAWSMVAGSQGILGIIPDYDGLRLCPCLPSHIKKVNVRRLFRNAQFDIEIINNGGKVPAVTVDNIPIEGNLVRLAEGKDNYSVKVTI